MLLARRNTRATRRAGLTAPGPFFLGKEVWLVAAVGILSDAFPTLEGELRCGYYPAVAGAQVGVILVTAGVQQRSRPTGSAARRGWDRVIVVGSALAAFGWGALLAGLLQGLPIDAEGHVAGQAHLATPFAAATGLALLAATRQPLPAVLLLVALVGALLAARAALRRGRPGVALAATGAALAPPVALVGAARWPAVLVSTVDPAATVGIADAAASGPTLRLLGWLLLPLLPALLGFQAMCWWVFRGRTDGRAPVYW
ncbi:cytochrome d ubiquinol oxidase subunit II [Micromonospora matsumotoense]|uniref:cytochrome d ubiquinol oxidase subunit II n=1 Tax=Micromonospora matsumotoense TaxID=121616 RepID=UPI00340F3DC3